MKLIGTIATVALMSGLSPAFAQTAPAQPAPEASEAGLEQIVVTAQRRSENLQKTPLALTAISGEKLESSVTQAQDLTQMVPSANITVGGGGVNVTTIRGIGTLASNGLAEQVVAYNLDGVYLSRPTAAGGQFYDLERVEVLKGPQGTLYGRNATAGAINLITHKPTFDTTEDLSGQFGNYGLFQAQGAVNVPLSSTVALRVAGQGISHDGYFSDGYDDQKQSSGRDPSGKCDRSSDGDAGRRYHPYRR